MHILRYQLQPECDGCVSSQDRSGQSWPELPCLSHASAIPSSEIPKTSTEGPCYRCGGRPYANLSIIASTAAAPSEDRDGAFAAGVHAFLTKPVAPDRPRTAQQNVLEREAIASRAHASIGIPRRSATAAISAIRRMHGVYRRSDLENRRATSHFRRRRGRFSSRNALSMRHGTDPELSGPISIHPDPSGVGHGN